MKIIKGIGYLLFALAASVIVLALMVRDPALRDSAASDEQANAGVRAGLSTTTSEGIASASSGYILPSSDVAHDVNMPAAMRAQLADVANAYADNARFPDYAKPLNANDWNLLHPRAFVERKASLANMPGLTATLLLDHYIIDRSKDQPVQVQLVAEPGSTGAVSATKVNVWLQQKRQRSAAMTLLPAEGVGQVFSGILPATSLRSVPLGETAVVAQVEFSNGERSNVTAMVKLYEPEARLLRLGDARVDDADLVIPATFEVIRAGHYLVAANLFNAGTNEPVSHLNAELDLSSDNRNGLLKVHTVTLRAKHAAGPYVLRDFDITRLPDTPGELTSYGSVAVESFAVKGFPLDSYSNEPYVDPEAQQRADFLKKLAAGQ